MYGGGGGCSSSHSSAESVWFYKKHSKQSAHIQGVHGNLEPETRRHLWQIGATRREISADKQHRININAPWATQRRPGHLQWTNYWGQSESRLCMTLQYSRRGIAGIIEIDGLGVRAESPDVGNRLVRDISPGAVTRVEGSTRPGWRTVLQLELSALLSSGSGSWDNHSFSKVLDNSFL